MYKKYLWKQNSGSAYIFVMVVMFTVFILLHITLSATRYQVRVSHAYMRHLPLETLALSAGEKVLAIFNDPLALHSNTAARNAWNALYPNLEQYAIYQLDGITFPFEGRFRLQNTAFQTLKAQKADELVWGYLGGSPYGFSYTVEAEGITYYIEVSVSRQTSLGHGLAITVHTPGLTPERLTGTIYLQATTNTREYIIPNFTWLNPPGWISQSVVEMASGVVDASVPLEPHMWAPDNPVWVFNTASSEVDVSQLYEDGIPIPSIILQLNPGGLLNLRASSEHNNIFRGLIFVNGDVHIENILIQGSLIAAGAVTYDIAEIIAFFTPVPNIWDEISITNHTLMRKTTDLFRMTNFRAAQAGENSINTVLYNAQFAPSPQIEIQGMPLRYDLKAFTSVTRRRIQGN